ncbi:hypothetical protein [Gorillibacterium massiliense]|uniref:hypothetical protein n=1 Tax=Gorillibacterium massiliense TaxID=1280390 RepID=UPI00307B2AFF
MIAYYFIAQMDHPRVPFPDNGIRHIPPRADNENRDLQGLFTTAGTIAVYTAAIGFSWFWFKKKRKSPSLTVRKIGKLLYAAHKGLGWATLALGAIHGTFQLINRFGDHKIYSGLASFVLMFMIIGYGMFIPKVRNKWMRTVHRFLGVIWVPVLILHAGGSAIIATCGTLAIGGLVWVFERGKLLSSEQSA